MAKSVSKKSSSSSSEATRTVTTQSLNGSNGKHQNGKVTVNKTKAEYAAKGNEYLLEAWKIVSRVKDDKS